MNSIVGTFISEPSITIFFPLWSSIWKQISMSKGRKTTENNKNKQHNKAKDVNVQLFNRL